MELLGGFGWVLSVHAHLTENQFLFPTLAHPAAINFAGGRATSVETHR